MVKKLTFFLISFFFLLTINFFLAIKAYYRYSQAKIRENILNEISQIYDPTKQFNHNSSPMVLGSFDGSVGFKDSRVANLKIFFRKYNSPLFDYAEKIVEVSDKYKFDYRLLPAIAMQESNLCRYIPENSYNCWGWGIYGDVVTRFNSYDEAIETVASGIRSHYINHGLVTASAIMAKYTPSSNGSWARAVNLFLKALE
ncbi:MAG: hypothetical protein QHH09_03810 [Microgenomates group bacterium]|nr:hypothetical protein [Microgenomates group bacterium]